MELTGINYHESTSEVESVVLLDRATPAYYLALLSDYGNDFNAACAASPTDPQLEDVTAENLPTNWDTKEYRKSTLSRMDAETKAFLEEYYDSSAILALTNWRVPFLMGIATNELALAMMNAVDRWIAIVWENYAMHKIASDNGGYVKDTDLNFNSIPEVPCSFANIQFVLSESYAAASPTQNPAGANNEEPEKGTVEYYVDWVAANS